MAMTLRLTNEEKAALKARAEADGILMQEAPDVRSGSTPTCEHTVIE